MADSTLVIKINGDIQDFQSSLADAQKSTENLESALGDTAKISAVAFAALTAGIGVTVAAYAESEAAAKDMNQVLQDQGIYSEDLVENYKDQADALSELTGIDADNITQGQAKLQSLIGQTQITSELSQAMVDLSTKTGSVTSAAELLGKGIEGNTTMLKRFGIEVDDNLDKDQRMAQLISAINLQFGGMAQVANTGLGSIQGLKTAFDDFNKSIGAEFAPLVTQAIAIMTGFFETLKNNKALTDAIVTVLAFGTAFTGVIATVTAIGAAFVAAMPYVTAFGVALGTALGPIALAVVGVAALAGGLAAYAVYGGSAKAATEDLNQEIQVAQQRLEGYQNALKNNVPYAVGAKNTEDLKNKISALSNEIDLMTAKAMKQSAHSSHGSSSDTGQDATKKAAADKRTKAETERDAMRLAAVKDHDKAMIDELNQHSAEVVKLEKEQGDVEAQLSTQKNAAERSALKEKLAFIKDQLEEQKSTELSQQQELQDDILANDQKFNALDAQDQARFMQKNKAALLSSIDTEKTAKQKAALDEAKLRIKNHNQFLQDEIKFGAAYASINQMMHTEIYEGSKQAFGDLAQLQQSSNSTLKEIGKVASIANIVMKTAESAMNIYAGFSTIPIVGPVLGIAGAAAAVAFGGEQISNVTSAADGGLMTGGIPGVDSIPTLTMPGELVVPTKNFDEVVNSVSSNRSGSGSGGNIGLVISMDGVEAQKVLTVRQNQAKALGTYVGVS